MTVNESSPIQHEEIAQLAYLNWQRDGRPLGRDQEYWLEAEQQLKATKHLLLAGDLPSKDKPAAAEKAAPRPTRKAPRRAD
jgi:hypothetical protein